MISRNVSPAAIAFSSKMHFFQNGKISCFSHDRQGFGSVKDTGGWGPLGAPSAAKRGASAICMEPLPLETQWSGVRDGQAACLLWKCWRSTFWSRHPQTRGSWFCSVTTCLFSRSYLLNHLFLNLMEASTWEGLLFQESAVKRKPALVLVPGEVCHALSPWRSGCLKEMLFCISLL